MGHLGKFQTRSGKKIELSDLELEVGLELDLDLKRTLELGSINGSWKWRLNPNWIPHKFSNAKPSRASVVLLLRLRKLDPKARSS